MTRLQPLDWYQWIVKDYRGSRKVARMPLVAKGLYRELLDECWLEGSIPDDIESIAELVDEPVELVAEAWAYVRKCFDQHPTQAGRLVNLKLEEQRTEKDRIRVQKQAGGRARQEQLRALLGKAVQTSAAPEDTQTEAEEEPAYAQDGPACAKDQLKSPEPVRDRVRDKEINTPLPPAAAGGQELDQGKKQKAPRNGSKAKAKVLSEDVLPWLEYSWNLFPTNYEAKDGKVRNLRLDRIKVEKLWLAILGGAFDSHLGGVTPTAEELACAAQVYLLSPHPRVKDGFASEIAVFYSISERSNSSNLWAEAVLKVRERRAKGQSSPPRPFDGTHPLLPKTKIHSDDPGAILAQPGHTPIIPLQEGFTLPEAIAQV